MAYTTQFEREIDNMLFRIEMDQDVEAAMDAQIELIESTQEKFEDGGFQLMCEENPDSQIFPQAYHLRLIRGQKNKN